MVVATGEVSYSQVNVVTDTQRLEQRTKTFASAEAARARETKAELNIFEKTRVMKNECGGVVAKATARMTGS